MTTCRPSSYVLHCIVFYFILFYFIALYCIVLYCIVLYCIVLYCIVLYCIVYANSDSSDIKLDIQNKLSVRLDYIT